MSRPIVIALAFLVCLASGRLFGGWLVSHRRTPPRLTAIAADPPTSPPDIVAGAGTADARESPSSSAKASPFSRALAWEHQLATLPVGEFPGLIQKEIATTRDPHRVFRLLGVWTERDPDGALAWARTQPSTIPLPEFGYNIPAVSGVLSAIAQKDPDRAWNLAQEFAPDRTDVERWELIGAMARRDPDQARDFVRKHVDELKSMNNPNAGWYGLNPEKVMPVAMELPPGPVRLEVVREMTRYYEEREDQLEAAERWFQTLPRAEQEAVADSAKTGDPFSEVSAEYREQLGKVWRLPEASSPN